MKDETTRGFMYIAIGEDYVEEAAFAATKLRESNPDVNIAVVTDSESVPNVFDYSIPARPAEGWETKVKNIDKYPFDKTIFLDTDTVVTDDVSELFELLGRFDVICAPKQDYYVRDYYPDGIPDCFTEFNTGVIGLRKCSKTDELLTTWEDEFEQSHSHDQVAFRTAMYRTDLRYHQLPIEYNLRFPQPGHINNKAKIFHTRPRHAEVGTKAFEKHIAYLESKINNKTDRPRAFIGTLTEKAIVYELHRPHVSYWDDFSWSYVDRLKMSLQKDGISGTIKKGVKKIF